MYNRQMKYLSHRRCSVKSNNPYTLLLILGLLIFGGAGHAIEKKRSVGESDSPPPNNNLMNRQTEFAFRFFEEINNTEFGRNVFISPLSAMLALAMTYNGAENETKAAMADALELQGLEREDVNAFFKELSGILKNIDPEVELSIANSIWSKAGLKFKEEFFDSVSEYYDAELQTLTDAATVNNWVSEKTRKKIRSILDQVSPEDIMVLINAIYFKGMWKYKFDSSLTCDRDFTLLDGSTEKRPMMFQSGTFKYYEDAEFQAIGLPYGEGKLSMYVFLPSKQSSLRQVLDSLKTPNWDAWLTRLHPMKGDIILPRFKLEYDINLNDVLKAMGMGIAFNPSKADFSGMYQISDAENVFISLVKQKTFVEVNEEGTEAAAVTSVTMKLTSVSEPEPEKFKMVVDRPFFCAIIDNTSGTVLFMGAIVDPQ